MSIGLTSAYHNDVDQGVRNRLCLPILPICSSHNASQQASWSETMIPTAIVWPPSLSAIRPRAL